MEKVYARLLKYLELSRWMTDKNKPVELHTKEKDKGMWEGRTIEDLKKEVKRLKEKEPKTEANKKRMHQALFAIRAKQKGKGKWGKIRK